MEKRTVLATQVFSASDLSPHWFPDAQSLVLLLDELCIDYTGRTAVGDTPAGRELVHLLQHHPDAVGHYLRRLIADHLTFAPANS